MIGSIGSSGIAMQAMQSAQSSQRLSADQQTLITDTLAKYDADSLTESDAQSIIDTLSEAGIQPGRALESALADEGFDARTIGELAGAEQTQSTAGVQGAEGPKGPPPPPPQDTEETESAESTSLSSLVDYLEELMAERSDVELSETDKQEMYSQIAERFGLNPGDSLVSMTA